MVKNTDVIDGLIHICPNCGKKWKCVGIRFDGQCGVPSLIYCANCSIKNHGDYSHTHSGFARLPNNEKLLLEKLQI